MFSGIIRTTTKITEDKKENESLFLSFEKPDGWNIQPGDSISTNGVCLTVKEVDTETYIAELMPETLIKTTFGENIPEVVNLEPSLKLGDPMDGHLVTGHIDVVGKVEEIIKEGNTHRVKISFPEDFGRLLAEKGSVTVDGVSLTVVDSQKDFFTVSLVDYTWQNTALSDLQVNSRVNLEFDILAKYVNRMLNMKN